MQDGLQRLADGVTGCLLVLIQALQTLPDCCRRRQVNRAAVAGEQGLHGILITLTQPQWIILNGLQAGSQRLMPAVFSLVQCQQPFHGRLQCLPRFLQEQTHLIAVGKVQPGFHTPQQGSTTDVFTALI